MELQALHVLELIHATLCVALADLTQRLVLVASLANILAMNLIVCRLFRFVARLRQILLEGLDRDRKRETVRATERERERESERSLVRTLS